MTQMGGRLGSATATRAKKSNSHTTGQDFVLTNHGLIFLNRIPDLH